MRDRLAGLAIGVLLGAVGCSRSNDVATTWQEALEPVLLAGHGRVNVVLNEYDHGVRLFRYDLPGEAPSARVVGDIRALFAKQFTCYSVLEQSQDHLRLRCDPWEQRHWRVRQYDFFIRPDGRVVVGLAIENDMHPLLQRDFERRARDLAEQQFRGPR